jgi:hypothetical protein
MLTANQRATLIPTAAPSEPRLSLGSHRADGALLDGGWWPRSWDPEAELPGLILALTERYGLIRHVMLNSAVWEGRFRRLAVGPDVVRVGWYVSLNPALLVATTDTGAQLDLLVVPPTASASEAEQAMSAAADATNVRSAPDILAGRPSTEAAAAKAGAASPS